MKVILFASVLFSFRLHASLEPWFCGARSMAAGGVIVFTDSWSGANNPAAACFAEKNHISLYSGRRFQTAALAENALSYLRRNKKLCHALTLKNFGYSSYSESSFQMSLSTKLRENLSLGISLHPALIQNPNGKQFTIIPDASFFIRINPKLDLAAKVYNPGLQKLKNSLNDRIPAESNLSLLYHHESFLNCIAQLNIDLQYAASFSLGIEYMATRNSRLSMGYNSRAALISAGFGIIRQRIGIDLAMNYHPFLGISSSASLSFSL